jgi:hypothetical protein
MKAFFAILKMATLAACCTACATSFTGSAHVEDGRGGCEQKCRTEGMAFAGMVFMGEYSNACICMIPAAAAAGPRPRLVASAAAVAGGVSGVIVQMQAQQQQQQHQH